MNTWLVTTKACGTQLSPFHTGWSHYPQEWCHSSSLAFRDNVYANLYQKEILARICSMVTCSYWSVAGTDLSVTKNPLESAAPTTASLLGCVYVWWGEGVGGGRRCMCVSCMRTILSMAICDTTVSLFANTTDPTVALPKTLHTKVVIEWPPTPVFKWTPCSQKQGNTVDNVLLIFGEERLPPYCHNW